MGLYLWNWLVFNFEVSIQGIVLIVTIPIGLYQYYVSQKWKRQEFLANVFKEFHTDWHVQQALIMLDWSTFIINKSKEDDSKFIYNREMLKKALQTEEKRRKEKEGQQWGIDHVPEIDPAVAGSLTVIKGAEGEEKNNVDPRPIFSDDEIFIRISFDKLFEFFTIFQNHIENNLYSKEDISSYIKYYIDKICSIENINGECPTIGKETRNEILEYLKYYKYRKVILLFKSFGYIRV